MKETMKPTSEEGSNLRINGTMKKKVDAINKRFNAMPLRAKQFIVISFGMLMSMVCIVLVIQAVQNKVADTFSIEKINLPKDTFMNSTDSTNQLIPVGKLKGEINGEFEAFYVAVDGEGQVYINRNPSFGSSRFVKSEEWQPISRKQLEIYEKELHFIPHKSKGLKP